MRDPKLKQGILNRLKSIEGHIRGIQRMVEEDQYCIDVLNQTSAIHKALEKVDVMILENHLETCVTTAIRSDDPGERERVIRELLQLFNQQSAISGQRSAVSDQQSAISGQQSAIGEQPVACCNDAELSGVEASAGTDHNAPARSTPASR